MPAKKILTKKDIEQIEICAGLGLTITEISLIIGISRPTLNRKLDSVEEARDAYDRGRAIAKKIVTSKLFDLIEKGEPAAIFFYLKCQCGWREKDKIENAIATPITIYLPEKEIISQEQGQ
jgi:hypothetical protein